MPDSGSLAAAIPAQLKPLDRLPGEDVAAYLARLGFAPLPEGEPGVEYRQDASDKARFWARRASTGETLNARARCADCGRIVQAGVVARTPGGEWRCIPCRGDFEQQAARHSPLTERVWREIGSIPRTQAGLAEALQLSQARVGEALEQLQASGRVRKQGRLWLSIAVGP